MLMVDGLEVLGLRPVNFPQPSTLRTKRMISDFSDRFLAACDDDDDYDDLSCGWGEWKE